jgi:hypothetical protein
MRWREKAPKDFNLQTDAGPMKAVYEDQLVLDGPIPWIGATVSVHHIGRKGFQHEISCVQPYRIENVTEHSPAGVRVQVKFAAGGPRQGSAVWVDLSNIRDWW